MSSGRSEAENVVGRYRLEKQIGRGAMGDVYLAQDVSTGQRAALKLLHGSLTQSSSAKKRFLREARAARAVSHPNIIRVLEVFEHAGAPVIAMELLEGLSLEARLVQQRRLKVPEVAAIMVRVTSALGTTHAAGIVHRDLKPENVFLTKGPPTDVKVLDFGIAKLTAKHGLAARTSDLTKTGAFLGTPLYMSPEQALGEKGVDHRTDIWSIGVMLYRCLTGVVPTNGETLGEVMYKITGGSFRPIREISPDVPEDLAAMVLRMMTPSLHLRPSDLREPYAMLARYSQVSAPTFDKAVESPSIDDEPSEVPHSATIDDPATPAPIARSQILLAPSPLRMPSAGQAAVASTVVMNDDRGTAPSGPGSNATRIELPTRSSRPLVLVLVALLALALGTVGFLLLR